jgi:hypothetical protein
MSWFGFPYKPNAELWMCVQVAYLGRILAAGESSKRRMPKSASKPTATPGNGVRVVMLERIQKPYRNKQVSSGKVRKLVHLSITVD